MLGLDDVRDSWADVPFNQVRFRPSGAAAKVDDAGFRDSRGGFGPALLPLPAAVTQIRPSLASSGEGTDSPILSGGFPSTAVSSGLEHRRCVTPGMGLDARRVSGESQGPAHAGVESVC
jgi:hypothetical protein